MNGFKHSGFRDLKKRILLKCNQLHETAFVKKIRLHLFNLLYSKNKISLFFWIFWALLLSFLLCCYLGFKEFLFNSAFYLDMFPNQNKIFFVFFSIFVLVLSTIGLMWWATGLEKSKEAPRSGYPLLGWFFGLFVLPFIFMIIKPHLDFFKVTANVSQTYHNFYAATMPTPFNPKLTKDQKVLLKQIKNWSSHWSIAKQHQAFWAHSAHITCGGQQLALNQLHFLEKMGITLPPNTVLMVKAGMIREIDVQRLTKGLDQAEKQTEISLKTAP